MTIAGGFRCKSIFLFIQDTFDIFRNKQFLRRIAVIYLRKSYFRINRISIIYNDIPLIRLDIFVPQPHDIIGEGLGPASTTYRSLLNQAIVVEVIIVEYAPEQPQ